MTYLAGAADAAGAAVALPVLMATPLAVADLGAVAVTNVTVAGQACEDVMMV